MPECRYSCYLFAICGGSSSSDNCGYGTLEWPEQVALEKETYLDAN
jgi:hypothetical protein